ncbi:MAG: hypothetical protein U0V49_01920 [Saprospiraceae bacterium]
MKNHEVKVMPIEFVRELCIGKTESEVLEAEQNFREFMILIKDMANRLESKEGSLTSFENLQ